MTAASTNTASAAYFVVDRPIHTHTGCAPTGLGCLNPHAHGCLLCRLLFHQLEGLACRAGGYVQHLEAAAAAAAAGGPSQACWLAAGMQCDAGEWMPGAGEGRGGSLEVCVQHGVAAAAMLQHSKWLLLLERVWSCGGSTQKCVILLVLVEEWGLRCWMVPMLSQDLLNEWADKAPVLSSSESVSASVRPVECCSRNHCCHELLGGARGAADPGAQQQTVDSNSSSRCCYRSYNSGSCRCCCTWQQLSAINC